MLELGIFESALPMIIGSGGSVPLGFSYMIPVLIKQRNAYWCYFSVLFFTLAPLNLDIFSADALDTTTFCPSYDFICTKLDLIVVIN